MGDSTDGKKDVAELRKQLDEAQSRIETLRRQQSEAKSKAKAVIQKQREQAKEREKALESESNKKAEELDAVKALLRDTDATKDRLSQEKEELQILVDNGKGDLQRVLAEMEELQRKFVKMEEERECIMDRVGSENKELIERVAEMEEIITQDRNRKSNHSKNESRSMENGNFAVVNEEHKSAKERIAELEGKCKALRQENDTLRKTGQGKEPERLGGSTTDVATVQTNKLEDAERQLESLSKELDQALGRIKQLEVDGGEAERVSEAKVSAVEDRLKESEKLVAKLQSDLKNSEAALCKEKEKATAAEEKASEATSNEESKTILEAKIAEMERLVASKQADIVKVREKAKTYLKDINAEKREMEEKLKKDLEVLRKELEEEQEKVKLADQRVDNSSTELDNCLALIRDKQKTIQMLKMSLSTQKEAVATAKRESEMLRGEFSAYKERAKKALQEKESNVAGSEDAVERATENIRLELDRTRKEGQHLRRQLSAVGDLKNRLIEMTERAEKAEAAADLLRSNTSSTVSNTNYNQVDALEEKISDLEKDIIAARSAKEDTETQHETTKMRLEAAERALRATEKRTEEAERLYAKTIDELKMEIADLKTELERAKESSAAAYRTAAAAAKALSFADVEGNEEKAGTPHPKIDTNVISEESGENGGTGINSSYAVKNMLSTGHSTFAAAMEDHSESLRIANGEGNAVDEDLEAREKQIAVLTAQVAELGALLDEAQLETNLKSEQTDLLKAEVKSLDAKLAAAEKLKNGAPFSYLRTIVVRYLESDDPTLLPVIGNVLSFTEDEKARVKASRGTSTPASKLSGASSGYFSLPFLGSR